MNKLYDRFHRLMKSCRLNKVVRKFVVIEEPKPKRKPKTKVSKAKPKPRGRPKKKA